MAEEEQVIHNIKYKRTNQVNLVGGLLSTVPIKQNKVKELKNRYIITPARSGNVIMNHIHIKK